MSTEWSPPKARSTAKKVWTGIILVFVFIVMVWLNTTTEYDTWSTPGECVKITRIANLIPIEGDC